MKPEQQNQSQADDPVIARRVYERQIEQLYQSVPFAIVTTAIVVALAYFFLAQHIDKESLVFWLASFYILLFFRSLLAWRYFQKQKTNDVNFKQAELQLIITIALTALIWSVLGAYVFPLASFFGQILLFVLLMGVASAALTTLGYHRWLYNAFIVVIAISMLVGMRLSDFPNTLELSIAIVIYIAYLIKTSGLYYSHNAQMLRLQELMVDKEKALSMQTRMAEQSNQAKSKFLSRMSHELRTPLNAVLGLAELQAMDPREPLSGTQLHRSEQIQSAGRHLLSLVNDLLDFSRIETGDLQVKFDTVDVRKLLEDAASLVEDQLERHEVSLLIEQTDGDIFVWADSMRLKQVLVNLLDNAAKYNRRKGRVNVVFKKTDEDYWRISIIDSGYGISEEARKKLFQPFTRLHHEVLAVDGTGIGLSFSKQLVDLMQGRIGVDSRPGEGSCFWVEFTAAKAPQQKEARKPTRETMVSTDRQPAIPTTCHVLLAEDNPVNQEVTTSMLQHMDVEVTVVDNGEAALEELQRQSFDMVLMDCEMPVMNGYLATSKRRQQEQQDGLPHIPIIALTAHAVEGAREQCLEAGMDDFVSKPFTIPQLTEALHKWMPTPVDTDLSKEQQPPDDQQATSGQQAEVELEANAIAQLMDMEKNGTPGIVRRVIDSYLEHSPKLLQEIRQAEQDKDPNRLFQAAHTLKSSSLTVGAVELSEYCKQIEMLGRQGELAGDLPVQASRSFEGVEQALQKFTEEHGI